jgi:CBS domain-containing protein
MILDWWKFNSDFYSTDRKFEEVEDIAEMFKEKRIDLRPYMIEGPYTVNTTDRLVKLLEMMRHFHLRALPVVDPSDGTPVAIITRSDLFAYMSL